jgi:23S rRNA pseudouridine2605 synthase
MAKGQRPTHQFRKSRASNTGKPPVIQRDAQAAEGMRLNKYVAHCGICSRRQAIDLIKHGQISVNGQPMFEPGYPVAKEDKVSYRGKVIQPEANLVYILLNKPKGVITSVKDENGRKTVMDILGDKISERVFPVGRLDRDTTGLLLLTNDGDLAKKLTHPSHRVPKIYQAKLNTALTKADLEKIQQGLTLEDGPVSVKWVNYVSDQERDTVSLEIHVGRNRIVRRIFESLGYEVLKLDRVYLAGLTKKDLPRGFFRYLTPKEIILLRHFVH